MRQFLEIPTNQGAFYSWLVSEFDPKNPSQGTPDPDEGFFTKFVTLSHKSDILAYKDLFQKFYRSDFNTIGFVHSESFDIWKFKTLFLLPSSFDNEFDDKEWVRLRWNFNGEIIKVE